VALSGHCLSPCRTYREQFFRQVKKTSESPFDETWPQCERAHKECEPVSVFKGTVSDITGSWGLSLPNSDTATSTSKVAARTGEANSTPARKIPAAACTMPDVVTDAIAKLPIGTA